VPKPKVKSLKETVQNYVIGTIQGAFKVKRHWVKQGYDEDHAVKNAVQYGIGQISAGVGRTCDLETTIKIFREIAEISTAFANTLKEAQVSIEKS
jgi:hypothetical protein